MELTPSRRHAVAFSFVSPHFSRRFEVDPAAIDGNLCDEVWSFSSVVFVFDLDFVVMGGACLMAFLNERHIECSCLIHPRLLHRMRRRDDLRQELVTSGCLEGRSHTLLLLVQGQMMILLTRCALKPRLARLLASSRTDRRCIILLICGT